MKIALCLIVTAFVTGCASAAPSRGATVASAASAPPTIRQVIAVGENAIVLEPTGDASFRFALVPRRAAESARTDSSLFASPLIAENAPAPAAPRGWQTSAGGFDTDEISVRVSDAHCIEFRRNDERAEAARVCPLDDALRIDAPGITHAFGLGEQLVKGAGLNWIGRIRTPGIRFGNRMVDFEGGAVGNAHFPVLHALGAGTHGFTLFFDNAYAQTWDLRQRPWTAKPAGGPMRGYVFAGRDLPHRRADFLALTGAPPVPPRKAFGLWVSEYGFDDWRELEDKLATLRARQFPVDGFVLDLQWFGGIRKGSESSPMGGLQWDLTKFPDPAGKLAELGSRGVGIVSIEEPYVSRGVVDRATGHSVHETLAEKSFLARTAAPLGSPPVALAEDARWGSGGMLDWLRDGAGDFWHDWKRQPLIDAGLIGHWTDLGEPEMFDPHASYGDSGIDEAGAHNLYNLRWSASIARGYARHGVRRRPWILSRSGTVGSQRYGVAMWSGDIGSNAESLAAHSVAQLEMSLSGVDYFGSDTGGFHREAFRGPRKAYGDLYTRWLANSSLFDIPVRPHTENLCNCRETAPDRVGDAAANLFNLRRRYELLPYYYSLGHAAYRDRSPIVAPLAYHFETDPAARDVADEKMIGPWLLAATVGGAANAERRDVYLPAGAWYDWETGAAIASRGEWRRGVSLRGGKAIAAPLFAREGAIVPLGDRFAAGADDGRVTAALRLRVYPSERATEFTVVEDDGATIGYLEGQVRTTRVSQALRSGTLTIMLDGKGSYPGAPATRPVDLEVRTAGKPVGVSFNDRTVPELAPDEEPPAGAMGWRQRDGRAWISLGILAAEGTAKIEIR